MRKYILKLFFTTLVVGGNAINTLAQTSTASATGSASAHIITPLMMIKNVDMNFGNMAPSSSVPGSVVLSPSGVRSVTGGVTLPATSGTVSAASFTVTGESSYTFAITLPASCNISDGSGNTITGDAFTSNPASSGTLSVSGSKILNVGATLNLTAGQHPGAYTNLAGLPVTVNYN